jgi:GT2 family glycosyltransferase
MAEPFRPVRLVDVELTAPLPPLGALDGCGMVRALVRLHGVPLGSVTVRVRNGGIPARALENAVVGHVSAAALDHLLHDYLHGPGKGRGAIGDLLRSRCAHRDGPTPPMTVAVCTRGRPALLARCLEALGRLDYPALDLLVVDNAPTDTATADVVRARPGVRYTCEPLPGLDRARNRAVAEARCELLAFTDDDAVPDPGWARALAKAFASAEDVMAVTGPVVPLVLDTEAQELFERAGGFGMGFAPRLYRARGRVAIARYGEAGQLGTGANMAFRRTVFDAVGTFDPALDVGTVTNGGGDIEMLFRVVHAGWALAYTPAALVRHDHRRDRDGLREQLRNNGIGFSAYIVRSMLAHPGERLAFARVWLRWLVRWPLARFVRALVRGGPVPRDLLAAELIGAFAGLPRYPRARRIAAEGSA